MGNQPSVAAFLQGDQWAYTAGIIAVLVGASLVFFFPKKQREVELVAGYHKADVVQGEAVRRDHQGSRYQRALPSDLGASGRRRAAVSESPVLNDPGAG